MKLAILLTVAASLHAGAKGYSQQITLSLKNVPIEKVFSEIQQQTGYSFIYTSEVLKDAAPVSIEVKNASVNDVLDLCFKDQPVTYNISGNFVIVKRKEPPKQVSLPALIDIKGRVVNENGEPLVGATVAVKGSGIAIATNEKGEFILIGLNPADILIISNVGYETKEMPLKGKTQFNIELRIAIGNLDETIMIAYGTTTKRLNTSDVSKVTAEEISHQPVSNILETLQGRVPGLAITQSTGYSGSSFNILLRGQNSLLQGSEPLFIIDGVPLAGGNSQINQITNAAFQLSPFHTINPEDIESIEILKDADATAIYGSRGANGVILITTKKGQRGKTNFNLNVYSGFSGITRTMNMLNTKQYLSMRREGFANDSITPNQSNAPDLFFFDTTRNIDFKKLLIGNTARSTDVNASIEGGNTNTQFLLSSRWHKETTVLPTTLSDNIGSVYLNINHNSSDKKLSINFSASYSYDENKLPAADLSQFINTPPDIQLYNSTGNLNWKEGNRTFRSLQLKNPLAILKTKYIGEYQNLVCRQNKVNFLLESVS